LPLNSQHKLQYTCSDACDCTCSDAIDCASRNEYPTSNCSYGPNCDFYSSSDTCEYSTPFEYCASSCDYPTCDCSSSRDSRSCDCSSSRDSRYRTSNFEYCASPTCIYYYPTCIYSIRFYLSMRQWRLLSKELQVHVYAHDEGQVQRQVPEECV